MWQDRAEVAESHFSILLELTAKKITGVQTVLFLLGFSCIVTCSDSQKYIRKIEGNTTASTLDLGQAD